jgi:hypothetical protein
MIKWEENGQGYYDFSQAATEEIYKQLREVGYEIDSRRINLVAYNEGQGGNFWKDTMALSWYESALTISRVKQYILSKELFFFRAESKMQSVFEYWQAATKVLKNLTDSQMVQFAEIHSKHIKAWESEDRIMQHSFSNIKKVVWVQEENCFHVFYKRYKKFSPTWYHYTLEGDWY